MCDTSVTDGNLGAKNKKQRLYTIKDQYAPPPLLLLFPIELSSKIFLFLLSLKASV